MPRFILFSDVHLHNWNYIPLKHQLNCLLNINRYAVQQGIKHLLFSGDIFHSPSSVSTHAIWVWNKFLADVKRSDLSLTGISGNHDHYFKDGSVTALEAVNLLPKGKLLEHGQCTEIDGVPIKGIGYIDNKEELEDLLKNDKFPADCILLMHQGVNGVELNSKGFTLNEGLNPYMLPKNILHCFAGHYHSYKNVTNKLTIPGALIQLVFGDSTEARGFLDITVDKGIEIKRVYNIDTLPSNLNVEFEKVKFEFVMDVISSGKFTSEAINIKITEVPSEKALNEIKDQILIDYGQSLSIEYLTKPATSPELIKSEAFSTKDFFQEYIESRKLTEEQIKIGKEIIYG